MSTASSHDVAPRRLKVLALVTDGWGMAGGIARYNRDFLTALAASATVGDVVVLPRSADTSTGLPAHVVQLASRTGRMDYSLAAFKQALSQRYDLIFCGHLFMAPLAAALSRLARTPLWLQLHGIESWARPSLAIRRAVRRARLITAVSRATRNRALAWSDIEPERLRVLPNTIDERFSPGAPPADLVDRLGTRGRRVILTVGRLSSQERYKGHDRVIEALPRISSRYPEILYLIAGDGDDRDRLAGIGQRLGVSDLIRFAGPVSDDQLPDIYRLADVFAMPSTGEGFGIVFLEAAATGLPIVAAKGDGSTDALADGELGTLIDLDAPQALAEAIIAYLDRGRTEPERPSRFAFSQFAAQVDHLVSSRF
ncbi:glycosyltransferase family 4 protein [Labrys sp. KNU-23]|uniref:glycosyltransferase family 4 protein n=1 Tax=Labrys sp. KNU-23 TaxID=2789216 RepID=UPI0011EF3E7C|nr:glycosyltransferase family 4 protein [Labrys sp. KNU-23]QEN85696.1 glycosyltransferase family 4 protein [Labrys sp. KNU-23]